MRHDLRQAVDGIPVNAGVRERRAGHLLSGVRAAVHVCGGQRVVCGEEVFPGPTQAPP